MPTAACWSGWRAATRTATPDGCKELDYQAVLRALLDRSDLSQVVVGNGTLVVYAS